MHDFATPPGSISGTGPADVWALGGDGRHAFHFDGHRWSAVDVPNPAGHLRTIWASAPNDVWAAGTGTLLHFDGAAWAALGPMTAPNEGIAAIAGTPGGAAVAVGDVGAILRHAR